MNGVASKGEWRRGWKVAVAGAASYGSGLGLFMMTAGIFINPMKSDLGWSTSAATLASTVAVLMAFTSPVAGFLSDRYGGRPVAIIGMLLVGLSFLGLAVLPPTVVGIYALAIAIGLFGPMTSSVPLSRCIASWFRKNVGSALGVAFNGTIIVSLFAIPGATWAVNAFGWQAGFGVLAAISLLFGLPLIVAWLREDPSRKPSAANVPAGGLELSEVLADWRFWAIVVAVGLGAMSAGLFLVHLQPMMIAKGASAAAAASLMVVFALCSGVGKLAGGVLLDRFWDCGVSATLFALAAVGAVVLAMTDYDQGMVLIVVLVALLGIGNGLESDLIVYFPLQLFGERAYSRIVGWSALISSLGMSFGAFAAARIYDLTDDYGYGSLVGALGFASASAIILVVGLLERAWGSRRHGPKHAQTQTGNDAEPEALLPVG